MSKPSLLLAAGCSWVVGKNVELPSIFAKLLQEQLGLDEFHSVAVSYTHLTLPTN